MTQLTLFTGRELVGKSWPFGELMPYAYDFIMIDPAWRFLLRSAKGERKSPQAHYKTMTIEDIRRLPVSALAAENCLLWMWATAPMLPLQLEVMTRYWGFKYVTMGAWHKKTINKKTSFGGGYVLRSACEPFLIGKIGRPITTKSTRNIVEGLTREHSRKPEEAYHAAERLMPNARRADVYSRTTRAGWEAYGDEAGKFDEVVETTHAEGFEQASLS